VLGVLVLLVGLRALANRRGAGRDGEDPFRRIGGKGKKETLDILAESFEGGKGVAGAMGNALAILEGVLRDAPATGAKSTA
jgi:hypothetical protein